MLLAGCSTGSNKYVQIMPTNGQSILQLYSQTQEVIAGWPEFSRSKNCFDKEEGSYYAAYSLQPELRELYRYSHISIEADLQEGVLFLIYNYEEGKAGMPVDQQKLFSEIVNRLRKTFSSDRVVEMDFSDTSSRDSMLLHKYRERTIKLRHVCS